MEEKSDVSLSEEEKSQINEEEKVGFLKRKALRKKANKKAVRNKFVMEREEKLAAMTEEERKEYWDYQAVRRNKLNDEKSNAKLRMKKALDSAPGIIIDFSYSTFFEFYEKSIPSLCSQVRYAFNHCKQFLKPLGLHLINVDELAHNYLSKYHYENWPVHISKESVLTIFDASKCIYLTPDADNTIDELLNGSSFDEYYFIIGAIVDPVVKCKLSLQNAISSGMKTARLPLDHLNYRCSVLNVDTVVHVLQHFYNHQELGWKNAIDECLPKREKLNILKSKKKAKFNNS